MFNIHIPIELHIRGVMISALKPDPESDFQLFLAVLNPANPNTGVTNLVSESNFQLFDGGSDFGSSKV